MSNNYIILILYIKNKPQRKIDNNKNKYKFKNSIFKTLKNWKYWF
jgi:hypothetical protein